MESMTGFGKAAHEAGGLRATVEVRGVNHKGLDIHLRMPQSLWSREAACREAVRGKAARGRVDVAVNLELLAEEAVEVRLSEGVLRSLGEVTGAMVKEGKLVRGLTFSDVLAVPEALSVRLSAARQEEAEGCLDRALEMALAAFSESRVREGGRLAEQFREGAEEMGELVAKAEAHAGTQAEEVKTRLQAQLAELGAAPESQRLEQEILLLAQKADVREELVRLRAHGRELERILKEGGGGQGRRLDHLFQEMQREVSTLLAKSATMELTRVGMDLRLLVEQLREQVQNVA